MTDPEMAAAHARDSRDLDRIRALQHAITAYLTNPPRRTHPKNLKTLEAAVTGLKADAAHIVQVWD